MSPKCPQNICASRPPFSIIIFGDILGTPEKYCMRSIAGSDNVKIDNADIEIKYSMLRRLAQLLHITENDGISDKCRICCWVTDCARGPSRGQSCILWCLRSQPSSTSNWQQSARSQSSAGVVRTAATFPLILRWIRAKFRDFRGSAARHT